MRNWLRGSCAGAALGGALIVTAGHPVAQQAAPGPQSTSTCQPTPARGAGAGAGRAAPPAGAQPGGQAPAGRGAGARAGGVGGAPPPIAWAAPTLPEGPIAAESAVPAHRNLRLVVTKGLTHPWGMAFLPDGSILITERPGCLRIVRSGMLDPVAVAGLP